MWEKLAAALSQPRQEDGLLRALVDEVKDNERRFLEWWAIGTKGVRFPKGFRFFEQHRVALLAAEDTLSRPADLIEGSKP